MAFLTLRQQTTTLQGVVVVNAGAAGKEPKEDEPVVSKQMLKYVNTIPVGVVEGSGWAALIVGEGRSRASSSSRA